MDRNIEDLKREALQGRSVFQNEFGEWPVDFTRRLRLGYHSEGLDDEEAEETWPDETRTVQLLMGLMLEKQDGQPSEPQLTLRLQYEKQREDGREGTYFVDRHVLCLDIFAVRYLYSYLTAYMRELEDANAIYRAIQEEEEANAESGAQEDN